MRLIACLLLSLSMCASAGAEVYKTTDEKGRVIYTDTPTDKTEKVELKETNVTPGFDMSGESGNLHPKRRPKRDQAPAIELYIVSPAPETHLNPGDRDLTVSFETNRPLEQGMRYQVLSNGTPMGNSSTDTVITIPEIHRGEHQISVIIYNEDQEVLAESEPVPVYVHRARVPRTD
ncbi:DUF4124 domain-containing protein [Simiduia sp. 21SJ11W-1]|uniref:DUF4124 domain-containing protein n=1 Tax=Simiduia sp. 21SJ11W-1 TaxID=2909669 RepID=UPI00209E0563|nr:DUF4124 domain-containing protein [Simiduia sp. 21SJ11W-1]UTA48478.1 DUF4124 domain-containing protein [Simiduia sp. 21SJ11W-1]